MLRQAVADASLSVGPWVDDALIAISEIVTNALVHAGTPIGLTIRVDAAGIRVEVADGSPHPPQPRLYAVTAGTGRGLALVQELVRAWGTEVDDPGKVVWFELGAPVAGAEAGAEARGVAEASTDDRSHHPDALEVELLQVPLLTHAAWQEHAASLLREYLLASLDAGDPDGGDDLGLFEAHAAASDALSVLFEQIPAPDVAKSPEELMAAATEPGVTESRVVLRMSATTATSFRRLDDLLEAAAALADVGDWLTVPTQPELRAFRQWLCDEVARQYDGAAPQPWRVPEDLVLPAPADTSGWDQSVVTASDRATIAADDTNRIVAVSPAAADLLGYRPDDLVGERLLTVIPWRYHQAHLAGFTMHLTTGRAPLLDRPVTVPFRCRDGSERQVALSVSSVRLLHGRHLFLADLDTP